VIEHIFSVVSDVEIFPAIVVIVADADTLAPAGVSETGLFCDIGESAVVIIVIEMARGRSCWGGIEACAVNDEDVRPAVVVVVEDGDARSRGFNDVFFGVYAAENDGICKACIFGDVGEMGEGLWIAIRKLVCAEENGKRQKKDKRNAGDFESLERTMSRTGNHELLAY